MMKIFVVFKNTKIIFKNNLIEIDLIEIDLIEIDLLD